MKTTLFAAIAVLGLALTAPAFAADANRDPVGAGARSTWRTNENGGSGAQQKLAAVSLREYGRPVPYVALSDSDALA